MKLFGRGDDGERDRAGATGQAGPPHDPGPAWALPADAGVAAGGSPVGPSTAAGLDARAGAAPGLDARSTGAAAPGGPDSVPPPDDREATASMGAEGATGGSALAAAQQRPELVVAGAFAGAFLAARLLRRITE